MTQTTVTFSSCFYMIHSKFPAKKYLEWMSNLFSIVHNFYLVLYTDERTLPYIVNQVGAVNPRIKIIVKPLDKFYNYRYKEYWVRNHAENFSLNDKSGWELNMLWAEKVHFVRETVDQRYFETNYYGWCDIGYFRNRPAQDMPTSLLQSWPNAMKMSRLNPNRIVYGCVNNDNGYIDALIQRVRNKRPDGLPVHPIPPSQTSIAGGFFLVHQEKISWWADLFDRTLASYFQNGYLVKDDQIILADCIFTSLEHFALFRESVVPFDNWFMFQRILN
jgi:hypothetical protein